MKRPIIQAAILTAMAAPATAQDDAARMGPASGQPTIRYVQGVPTLDLERDGGGVLVTPLPPDHGRIAFGVAVYNHGLVPVNFGPENIAATAGGVGLPLLTSQQLVAKARHRAFWAQVGAITATAIVAGIASTAHSYTSYRTVGITPRGTVFFGQGVVRDNTPGVVGAGLAAGAGGVAVASIRSRLDQTITRLGHDVLQTTTVDPEAGYGGRIVLDNPAGSRRDEGEIRLTVRLNDADYPFVFRRGGAGEAMVPVGAASFRPAQATYARASMPPAMASAPAWVPAPVPAVRPPLASPTTIRRTPVASRLSEAERYAALLRSAGSEYSYAHQ